MTRVGPYRVIGSKRLLIPQDQESWIHFDWEDPTGHDAIDIQLVFENDPDSKAPPTLISSGQPDHASFVFRNWKNPLGQSTAKPIFFAKTNAGEQLHFLAASWMIGDTRVIEIQVMAGGEK